MVTNYINYRFSRGFRHLMYMGMWPPDFLTKPSHKAIFYLYAFLWQTAMVIFMIVQSIDLYKVFGNFKKMTFNFCSSTIVVGIFIKMILLVNRREQLRSLIYRLWEDSLKYNTKEDIEFFDAAHKRFTYIKKILYSGPLIIIPSWGLGAYFSYKWGPRILPFAGYFPMDNANNDATFVPALIFEVIIGYYAVQTVLESDLTMLGAMVQIEAHYQILGKKLSQLEQVGEEVTDEEERKEINNRIFSKVKILVKRHLELLNYCDEIEKIFNRCMVIQLIGGSFLLVMNGVETTRTVAEVSLFLIYQVIYVIVVMFDLFIICYHFTTLTEETTNVGLAAYNSRWYNLDMKTKKALLLFKIRAQKSPKFTYGKLFIIDVNAYMHLIKNIFSWLILFRQLEMT